MYLCVDLQTNSSSCVKEFGGGKPLQMAGLATISCSCLRHVKWCLTQLQQNFTVVLRNFSRILLSLVSHSSDARERMFQKRHCLFTYCNREKGAGAHKCGPADSSANAATEIRGPAPVGAF
jgi:hypothetical protein